MRSFLEDILYDRRRDPSSLFLRATLRCLSVLYGAAVSSRTFLYSRGWLRSNAVPCRVVSIGNITVGGTGKTPVVIMTVRALAEAGLRTAVVSRGYLRDRHDATVISDGENMLLSAREAGDEPHLIASSLPGTPVVVGVKRWESARLAWERFRPEVIVLDDAFQHLPLRRDMDIVTLDAGAPFGTGRLLPRGTLRESPRALMRAGAVIITRFGNEPPSRELEDAVHRFHPGLKIFYSRHIPHVLRRISDGAESSPGSLRGRKIAALSNIANPDSFHRMLESLGAEIIWRCVRPDHYRYRPGEPEEIGRQAGERGADIVVMTAKDERNLPEGYCFGTAEAAVLEIEAVLLHGKDEYVRLVAP
ncbi:MAG: tetraacyldisaccharide 4'-kinase [Candidatus Latescibacterota bacterium]